jgi:radical SAM protein with 4Fe4S-binding SPASM domain
MDLQVFEKYANNLRRSGRMNRIVFSGLGETLLNPQLSDMIAYIKKIDLADTIEIITNASLLTGELTDKLLDSGLNKIKISLQGINADQYRENCGVNLDFTKFLKQLEYFYKQSRNRCEVYLKIIDVLLNTEKEREIFHQTFLPLGDVVNIEGLMPINGMSLTDDRYTYENTSLGFEMADKDSVCPMPFYMANIDIDGSVYDCCIIDDPERIWKGPCIGNVNEQSFSDIWNQGEHLRQMKALLNHKPVGACKECVVYRYRVPPNDVMKGFEPKILERIEQMERKIQNG